MRILVYGMLIMLGLTLALGASAQGVLIGLAVATPVVVGFGIGVFAAWLWRQAE